MSSALAVISWPVCFPLSPSCSFLNEANTVKELMTAGFLWQVGLSHLCITLAEPWLFCSTPKEQASHWIQTSWPWPCQFTRLSSHQLQPADMGQTLLAQQPTEPWFLCHLRVGNQWEHSWSLSPRRLIVKGTVVISIFPLDPCVQEPGSISNARMLLCSPLGKEGISSPERVNWDITPSSLESDLFAQYLQMTITELWIQRRDGHPQLDKWILLRERRKAESTQAEAGAV